jgi:Lon protease-like protein
MQTPNRIPLFPLGVVLMPAMPLPLHIFEERYKIMIGECLEEDKEFGIVYFSGNDISQVGCGARIEKVLKVYDNGELDILTIGRERFFIKKIDDTKPYLEADVVFFDDDPMSQDSELMKLAGEGLKILKELDLMEESQLDYGKPEELGLKPISFLIAQNEGFTPDEKQKFLEMTSTPKRLEAGVKALHVVLERAKLTMSIHTIIGGNGDIKKLKWQLNEY